MLDIFGPEITAMESELLQLQALMESKRKEQSLLKELGFEANSTISAIVFLKEKVAAVKSEAIASLKAAVLSLFSDGGDGGNNPIGSTPDPDPTNPAGDDDEDEEFDIIALNGETGQCLITDDLDEADTGDVPCASCGADLNDEANYPEYAAAAIAGICRSCEAKVIEAEKQEEALNEDTGEEDLIFHSDNDRIAYTSDADGKFDVWISFHKKAIAKSWLRFLEPMALNAELREYSEGDCKWRIFLSGLSLGQVSKLAQQDFHWKYNPEIGSAKPPEPAKCFEAKNVKIGYRVTRLLTPSEVFEVTTAVAADGTFFARFVLTGDRQLLNLNDIDIIAKPLAPGTPNFAKVLLPSDEYFEQKLPIVSESANYLRLKLPNDEVYSYRRDLCELCDVEIEAIADPTEPTEPVHPVTKRPNRVEPAFGDALGGLPNQESTEEQQEQPADTHSVLGIGDIVKILSDRYPQFHGHVGTITEITNGLPPIQVKAPRGIKPYHRQDLKLISKALPFSAEQKKELVGASAEFDF